MFFSKLSKPTLAILTLIPHARSQFISSLPQCVQDCIDSSQDDNCAVTNVGCLCRASAGNFLPDLITCIHGNCDNDLDNSLLLTPLQWACELAGAPIPESALRNAENQASSLATQVTMTVTLGASSSGSAQATTTIDAGSVTKETVTATVAGSSSKPGAVSTYTATDSKGSTTTQQTTSTATYSSSSSSAPSDSVTSSSTVTTTIATDTTSSSETETKTSTGSNPVDTNSSPFQDSNNVGARTPVGNLLGLTVALALGCVWF